eukprot:366303-Chlamydomonas_euryale.AAC.6
MTCKGASCSRCSEAKAMQTAESGLRLVACTPCCLPYRSGRLILHAILTQRVVVSPGRRQPPFHHPTIPAGGGPSQLQARRVTAGSSEARRVHRSTAQPHTNGTTREVAAAVAAAANDGQGQRVGNKRRDRGVL